MHLDDFFTRDEITGDGRDEVCDYLDVCLAANYGERLVSLDDPDVIAFDASLN